MVGIELELSDDRQTCYCLVTATVMMGDDSISLDAQARKCDSDNYFPPAFATGQITQVDPSVTVTAQAATV